MFRTVSYSVIRVTPGAGSSITSTIVSSTAATLTSLFGVFLGAFLAAVFSDHFFVVTDFKAEPPRRRTLDFAFFAAVRFVALMRAGLTLALRRFEAFLRGAACFFALAMAFSVEIPPPAQRSRSAMLTLPREPTKHAPTTCFRSSLNFRHNVAVSGTSKWARRRHFERPEYARHTGWR